MATIKLKRGTSTPTTSDLVNGEVALDLSAKKLYVNDSGTIKEIGSQAALSASQLNDINVVAGQVAHGTDLGSITSTLSTNSSASDITTVADNINDVNSFADRYQIGSSAPTARTDGTSLQDGDLWFDSTNNGMMAYDGSAGDGYTAIQPPQSTLDAIANVTGFVTFAEDCGSITAAVNTGSGNNSINTVGSNITNVNTVAGISSNVSTVATNIINVNAVAGHILYQEDLGSITSSVSTGSGNAVNTVGANIAAVQRYADEYTISSSSPSSPSAGDLWFSTTGNVLNYYSGSAWVGISPGISGVVNDANPQLANNLDCNNKNLTEVATISGDNLQIDFGTL